jgi:hypothetical protein
MSDQARAIVWLGECGCNVCEIAEYFGLPRSEIIITLRVYG